MIIYDYLVLVGCPPPTVKLDTNALMFILQVTTLKGQFVYATGNNFKGQFVYATGNNFKGTVCLFYR